MQFNAEWKIPLQCYNDDDKYDLFAGIAALLHCFNCFPVLPPSASTTCYYKPWSTFSSTFRATICTRYQSWWAFLSIDSLEWPHVSVRHWNGLIQNLKILPMWREDSGRTQYASNTLCRRSFLPIWPIYSALKVLKNQNDATTGCTKSFPLELLIAVLIYTSNLNSMQNCPTDIRSNLSEK